MSSSNTGRSYEHPAADRALTWLRGRIDQGSWQPFDRLPSLEILAGNAGVGRLTMWRAVRVLVNEGRLTARRGSGIVLGSGSSGDAQAIDAWRDIATRIISAIGAGEYLPDAPLPPQSKLLLRYRVNYRTLHKSLAWLTARKILVRTGTRYLVPTLNVSGAPSEVVFFSEPPAAGNERQEEFAQLCEPLAQKRFIRLVRQSADFDNPIPTLALKKSIAGTRINGFVVDYWGAGLERRERHFFDLLAILQATGKPVVILDEVGNLVLPDYLQSNKQVWVITIAAAVAGAEMGRFLIRLGHRHSVFLTLRKELSWSRRRFIGLRQAFVDAGIGENNVELWSTESLPDPDVIVCAAARLTNRELTDLFPDRSEPELAQLSALIVDTIPRLRLGRSDTEQTRQVVLPIISACRAYDEFRLVLPIRAQMFVSLGGHLQGPLLSSLFGKLLQQSPASAWVAATDGTAIFALDYLKAHAPGRVGRIAICGFDNSLRAAIGNITSYSFDAAGFINQALTIAMGQMSRASASQRVVEWPGQVIVRGTTPKPNA